MISALPCVPFAFSEEVRIRTCEALEGCDAVCAVVVVSTARGVRVRVLVGGNSIVIERDAIDSSAIEIAAAVVVAVSRRSIA